MTVIELLEALDTLKGRMNNELEKLVIDVVITMVDSDDQGSVDFALGGLQEFMAKYPKILDEYGGI